MINNRVSLWVKIWLKIIRCKAYEIAKPHGVHIPTPFLGRDVPLWQQSINETICTPSGHPLTKISYRSSSRIIPADAKSRGHNASSYPSASSPLSSSRSLVPCPGVKNTAFDMYSAMLETQVIFFRFKVHDAQYIYRLHSNWTQLLTGIMQKDGIAILRLANDSFVGVDDVIVGGFGMIAVVEEYRDVFFLESVYILCRKWGAYEWWIIQ